MSFSYSCSRNLGVGFVETMVELEYLSVARKYNHTVFLDTNGDNETHDDVYYVLFVLQRPYLNICHS